MESFTPYLKNLEQRKAHSEPRTFGNILNQLIALLNALEEKGIAAEEFKDILARLESMLAKEELHLKQLATVKMNLLERARKNHGFIPPKFYQRQWMLLGWLIFGLPISISFSSLFNNFGYFGLGLAIGIPVGLAIGKRKDKEAEEQGKVLAI